MPLTQEQIQHVQALGWAPEHTSSIHISDVWMSRDVQISIGRQLNSLCATYDLPFCILRQNIGRELYWHEESDQLGLMLQVRDSHVESLYLQIPSGHWGFKEAGLTQ